MSSRWIASALALLLVTGGGRAMATDVAELGAACGWLDAAVAASPERDDAFGMFMRAMRPKCQGTLEGIGRGDGSVTDETITALVKELNDLRSAIVDAPMPTPATTPDAPVVAPSGDPVAVPPPVTDPAVVTPPAADPVGSVAPPGDTPRREQFDTAHVRGAVSGTWFQAPRVVLDRHVKRTLDLFQEGRTVQGELYEEVWYDAPASWVDTSCGGNGTFRMVTTARVAGDVVRGEVELRRDIPRVLACTCPSRCRVEQRRRGLSLMLSPSGMQLSDDTGVFVREGAPPVGAAGGALGAAGDSFAGEWETPTFERRGERLVLHLLLREDGRRVEGTLTVSSDQALPLNSWADRFCGGADRFSHVDAFEVAGERSGSGLTLSVKKGRVMTCTCPSKCLTPKRRRMTLTLTPDGRSLTGDEATFERR
ncbi:MAG: hypothetical protein EP329_25390 [Deltaproteobacteria bacterium]|nr:MAG: hypothetical protein EP329_25390 [Deltaproteobacteria bacterium]